MEVVKAVAALFALAQESRLAIFRRLVATGPEGLPAGRIATDLKLPPPTLSFHLSQLEHAGLLRSRRQGRQVLYSADYDRMEELLRYLTENCCAGAAACAPRRGAGKETHVRGRSKRRSS